MKKFALLAVLGIIAALGIAAPSAMATASCTVTSTPFHSASNYPIAAQVTFSSCADTKYIEISSSQSGLWDDAVGPTFHAAEIALPAVNCPGGQALGGSTTYTCGTGAFYLTTASLYLQNHSWYTGYRQIHAQIRYRLYQGSTGTLTSYQVANMTGSFVQVFGG